MSSIKPAHAAGSSASIPVLAVAAFIIVTTEFLIVGLLPALARDLGISVASAGQLVTLFAVVVMLFGPFLTAWLANVDRKRLFIAILLLFAFSNGLAAIASNIWVLALARLLPALALPVFWGTASETAAQIAGPGKGGRAVSTVYLGISAAMLFGIPLGTLASDAIGWRGAFGLLAALSLLIALLMAVTLPHVRAATHVRMAEQARILKSRFFLANVALSILVFTAMFTGYTYLAEMLEKSAGIAPALVGWWLMGFGAVGLVGNWLGGLWVDQKPLATTAAFCVVLAVGMTATTALAGGGAAVVCHCAGGVGRGQYRALSDLPDPGHEGRVRGAGPGRHHQCLGRQRRHCAGRGGRRFQHLHLGTGQRRLCRRRGSAGRSTGRSLDHPAGAQGSFSLSAGVPSRPAPPVPAWLPRA